MNMPVSESSEPTPELVSDAPAGALDVPAEAASPGGPGDTTFELPIPLPMPDELLVPPMPVAEVISELTGSPEIDPMSPQQEPAPRAISLAVVPERPMPATLESLPDPPVPAIPPSPLRSIFEQGIGR
jgi:hypothetical protein